MRWVSLGETHPMRGNRPLLRTLVMLALSLGGSATAALRAAEAGGHFTVFSSRSVAGLVFEPRPAAPKQKLTFFPTARSPRYDYRTAMPLRFTDATTGMIVAEATIPSDIKDALLLFSTIEPAPASGLRYQVAILDDGVLRHGPGGLSILNLSGLPLAGTVGTESVTLKAGLNSTINVGTSAKIILRTADKGRAYQAYSETVSLKKAERALLILFPPYYKGSHEVQSRLLIDNPTAASATVSAPKKK